MGQLWQRSRTAEVLLGLSGMLTFPVAAVLLGGLYLATHPGPGRLGLSGAAGILLVVAVLLLGCALTALAHEGLHALALVLVGRVPALEARTRPYPLLCVDHAEPPYGRGRFVLVMLAPVVLLTVVMLLGVVVGPYGAWLIVPTAFQLTASKLDIAYAVVALRQPSGTTCRISEDGLELTPPTDLEVP